jgi:hypothetical protein
MSLTRRPLAALAVALCVALPALFAADAPVRGQEVAVPELIDQAAAYEGIPWAAPALKRIAWCESRWFPGAYNRRSGASGLFQFIPSTWAYASRMAGFAGESPFAPVANVFSAAWLYRVGGPRHWSCR